MHKFAGRRNRVASMEIHTEWVYIYSDLNINYFSLYYWAL